MLLCRRCAVGCDGRESPLGSPYLGANLPLLAAPAPAAASPQGSPFGAIEGPAGAPATPPSPQPQLAGTPAGSIMTCEGSRLEGVILRSQLLVLLQRRHFCDQHGRPVGREYSEKQEIELEVGFLWAVLCTITRRALHC